MNKSFGFADYLVSTYCLAKLAYPLNMFGNLNKQDLGLRGKNKNIFTLVRKFKAFIRKIVLGNNGLFSMLDSISYYNSR
jgi:hypothetical protein